MNQSERVQSITRCVEEIARAVDEQSSDDLAIRWLAAIGEMDQRTELHRLIHE